MKIGVFGSAFNPPHIGHFIICEQARIKLGLDKVIFVPTGNPYHKNVELLAFDQRYEMVKEAIDDNKYFEVSDIERNIKKNSYSYDLIIDLKKIEKSKFYFIMGSDSFLDINKWYRYEEFLKLVDLVIIKRPGYDICDDFLNKYRNISTNEIYYYDDIQVEVSSTYIRDSIKEGYIPKYLLHPKTYEHIKGVKTW